MNTLNQKLNNLPESPEGHWDDSHIQIINSLKKYNLKTILEIGFNNGYSATLFLNLLSLEKFYSLDIGIHPFVRELQEKFKQDYENIFFPIIEDSLNIRKTFLNDIKYDLIFIDGGHKYEVALNDFLFSLDKAKYILLDDTGGYSEGVTELLQLIMKGSDTHEPLINRKVKLLENFNVGAGALLFECI